MTTKSAPYFWIECDVEDCKARSPSEDYEVTAWGAEDDAWTNAEGSDCKRDKDGRDYCYDHAAYVCERCATFDGEDYPGEREYLCRSCSEGDQP